MQYSIIIIKEQSLEMMLGKIKNSLESISLCDPGYFLPSSSLFNTHSGNTNYIFKIKPESQLNYLIVEYQSKEEAVLNSIANQYDAGIEVLIGDKKSETSLAKTLALGQNKWIIISLLAVALQLDLGMAIIYYLLNFNLFLKNNKLWLLNTITILSGTTSLLSLNILGYSLPEIANIKAIIQVPPNIGHLAHLPFIYDYTEPIRAALMIFCTILITIFTSIISKEPNNKIKFALNKQPQNIKLIKF